MNAATTLSKLSDDDLIANFQDLVISEQEQLVLQLDHLAELDRRKLFREYSSLRAFLISEFGMEEWQAERRIRAARLLVRFPDLREKLRFGKLNLSLLEIVLGYAHREKLSEAQIAECFEAVSGMTCEAAKREMASRYPASQKQPGDRITPLTGELSELRCVFSNATVETLEEIRGLLAHSHPGVTLGELIGVIAKDYRDRHHPEEKAKRAVMRRDARRKKMRRDRPESQEETTENLSEVDGRPALPLAEEPCTDGRFPSQKIEHEMILRSGYQCEYVEPSNGKRCTSRHALERDHVVSWADGGATSLSNLRFVCVGHHRRISYLRFGESSNYIGRKLE